MKKLRLRFGAVGLAAAVAAGTMVGALALQDDSAPRPQENGSAAAETVEDEPILYAGGYGLFPSR